MVYDLVPCYNINHTELDFFMSYIILIAGVLSLFIGFLALKSGEKKKEIVSFAFFCFAASVWIILNFFLSYFRDPVFLDYIYAAGALVPACLLSWVYLYVKKGNALWKHLVIYSVAVIIAGLSLFTQMILGDASKIGDVGIEINQGPLFPLFGIFLIVSVIISIAKMFVKYRKSEGKKRKKIKMILLGISGFTVFSLLVSSVLPMFGIFSLTNLDSPSALIFVIFTFLAIIKYKFLKIKIVLVHFFVAVILVMSAVEIFFSNSSTEMTLRTIFFLILFFFGVMLLNSVMSEVQKKEELEIANAKLLKLDKSKSEFISIASHQLRTPLTSMKGFISIMKNGSYGKLPRKLEEPIHHIEIANERLISLVKNMLDISRIEAGGMAFEFKSGNINELVNELYHSFLHIANEKGNSLEIKIDNDLPAVKMDRGKIRELLSNLIDNAIEYTENGHIEIETKKKKGNVQILVSDTGIGISKGEVASLFDKFSRGKKARQIKKNGSGLGLYLGKKIAEAHDGKIYARSKGSSKGSTFFVELPLE